MGQLSPETFGVNSTISACSPAGFPPLCCLVRCEAPKERPTTEPDDTNKRQPHLRSDSVLHADLFHSANNK
jgi:hypothetical protein